MRKERPDYAGFSRMEQRSTALAEQFADQILATTAPFLGREPAALDVLDVGSGYGATARALASRCRSVHGVEPTSALHDRAEAHAVDCANLRFTRGTVHALPDDAAYDLVVLDNVYEHIAEQQATLEAIDRALRPGGAVYLLTPNRLWPIEAHYRLPLLSWLPLPAANVYLRLSGRGHDYTDASYARTWWTLRRACRRIPGWQVSFTLPASVHGTYAGMPVHYRVGIALLKRFPFMWCASKALLVVIKKAG